VAGWPASEITILFKIIQVLSAAIDRCRPPAIWMAGALPNLAYASLKRYLDMGGLNIGKGNPVFQLFELFTHRLAIQPSTLYLFHHQTRIIHFLHGAFNLSAIVQYNFHWASQVLEILAIQF
jgi:hypothetical protein